MHGVVLSSCRGFGEVQTMQFLTLPAFSPEKYTSISLLNLAELNFGLFCRIPTYLVYIHVHQFNI